MECRECKIKNRTISSLQTVINKLSAELHKQQMQLDHILNEYRKIGADAEKYILDLIDGATLAKSNAPSDIVLSNGKKIEVKRSRLNRPKDRGPTLRWSWHRVFGEKGETKDWTYLILSGDKDTRYWPIGVDKSPFVFFLLDKEIARIVSAPENKKGHIYITTNPKTVRSLQGKRLLKCRITEEAIQRLFSNISPAKEDSIKELISNIKIKINLEEPRILKTDISSNRASNNDYLNRCVVCGISVSERVRQYCLKHPERFGNKVYCYTHQQSVTNNE